MVSFLFSLVLFVKAEKRGGFGAMKPCFCRHAIAPASGGAYAYKLPVSWGAGAVEFSKCARRQQTPRRQTPGKVGCMRQAIFQRDVALVQPERSEKIILFFTGSGVA